MTHTIWRSNKNYSLKIKIKIGTVIFNEFPWPLNADNIFMLQSQDEETSRRRRGCIFVYRAARNWRLHIDRCRPFPAVPFLVSLIQSVFTHSIESNSDKALHPTYTFLSSPRRGAAAQIKEQKWWGIDFSVRWECVCFIVDDKPGGGKSNKNE